MNKKTMSHIDALVKSLKVELVCCGVVFNTIIVSISASRDSRDRDAATATRLIAASASWPS